MDDLNEEIMKAADILLNGWGKKEPDDTKTENFDHDPDEESSLPGNPAEYGD